MFLFLRQMSLLIYLIEENSAAVPHRLALSPSLHLLFHASLRLRLFHHVRLNCYSCE